jgi:hypothetical protein
MCLKPPLVALAEVVTAATQLLYCWQSWRSLLNQVYAGSSLPLIDCQGAAHYSYSTEALPLPYLRVFVCIAVNNQKVVVQGTILDYTFTLTNGKMAVPDNSSLNIALSHTHLGNITCSTGGVAVPLDTNITTSPALSADAVVTCNFAVNVTDVEKTNALVPAITVTPTFGQAASAMIFSVPAATTATVQVFNGNPLIHSANQAVSGPSVTGKPGWVLEAS